MTAVAERVLAPILPERTEDRRALRRDVLRVIIAANLVLGLYYLTWRWTSSINWGAWFIALPLILAETYSFIDGGLFGLTMWRIKERGAAPPASPDATVDVFITTYNEPVELVRETARAAKAMRHPHSTFILDDGASPEMEAMAREEGIGYITRSAAWKDRPRHAKAGNLNNALFETQGEFLCILDADQVADPSLLERTLGWFEDPGIALVQTPQWFTNVGDSDPLGSQAPLFYGPIQQGKDGWNAAFFCGSNAVLRREALMQLGVVGYVTQTEAGVRRVLKAADAIVKRARRGAEADARAALDELQEALGVARRCLEEGLTIQEVTHRFRRDLTAISRRMVLDDLREIHEELNVIEPDAEVGGMVIDEQALDQLAARELSPLQAIESVRALVEELDAVQSHEAQPVMPMATISVTEDMATAMRLHGLGWRSVYHHEILVHGLAPEDLQSMLHQRLRWAQGTLQVMLRENPLVQRGLSAGQRAMYFATMWTYLSGFAALAYIAAPILYLVFGIAPVDSFGEDFVWHLVPFLLVNQLLFFVVGYGKRTWRGQQYSLALFPLWIRAVYTAIGNVWFKRSLGFVVTPKTRQGGAFLRLVRPQLVAMALLAVAAVIGLVRLMVGATDEGGAIMLNIVWVIYDLVVLSVVIDAALYQGYEA